MKPAAGQRGPDLPAIRKLAEDCYDSYLADLRSLVNLDCVHEIQEGVGREHFVVLEDGTRLRLSDRYRRRLEERSLPPC